MAAERIHTPDWVYGPPMSAQDVARALGFSYGVILTLRQQGIIHAIIARRPYRFDPAHIFGHKDLEICLTDRLATLGIGANDFKGEKCQAG